MDNMNPIIALTPTLIASSHNMKTRMNHKNMKSVLSSNHRITKALYINYRMI